MTSEEVRALRAEIRRRGRWTGDLIQATRIPAKEFHRAFFGFVKEGPDLRFHIRKVLAAWDLEDRITSARRRRWSP